MRRTRSVRCVRSFSCWSEYARNWAARRLTASSRRTPSSASIGQADSTARATARDLIWRVACSRTCRLPRMFVFRRTASSTQSSFRSASTRRLHNERYDAGPSSPRPPGGHCRVVRSAAGLFALSEAARYRVLRAEEFQLLVLLRLARAARARDSDRHGHLPHDELQALGRGCIRL